MSTEAPEPVLPPPMTCATCGFSVPSDDLGREVMNDHLLTHALVTPDIGTETEP